MRQDGAVVPGTVSTAGDVDVLTRTLHEEPDSMAREHAAWALEVLEVLEVLDARNGSV